MSADGFSGSVTSGATGRVLSANTVIVTPNPGESVAAALTRLLSGAAGGASAEEPVEIVLSGVDAAALATGSGATADALGALFSGFNGKYVSVDLSACTGTSIGDSNFTTVSYARQNKDKLVSVIFPEGLESIGDYAFMSCSGLTAITLPASLTTIGNNSFQVCSGLTTITLPEGLESIGEYAFSGCTGLTAITLPASLTTIGDYAFMSCTGVTTVTANRATPPTVGWSTFANSISSIKVPADSVAAYRAGAGWWSTYAISKISAQ